MRRPAAILGHFFRGDAMRVHVPCDYAELSWSLAALVLIGAGLGLLVALLREA